MGGTQWVATSYLPFFTQHSQNISTHSSGWGRSRGREIRGCHRDSQTGRQQHRRVLGLLENPSPFGAHMVLCHSTNVCLSIPDLNISGRGAMVSPACSLHRNPGRPKQGGGTGGTALENSWGRTSTYPTRTLHSTLAPGLCNQCPEPGTTHAETQQTLVSASVSPVMETGL